MTQTIIRLGGFMFIQTKGDNNKKSEISPTDLETFFSWVKGFYDFLYKGQLTYVFTSVFGILKTFCKYVDWLEMILWWVMWPMGLS